MSRSLVMIYAVVVYGFFFAVFLYLIGFVGNFPMLPVTVDRGLPDTGALPLGLALATDAGLIALFAIQHSVMARPSFKRQWNRVVPPEAERSTYVLLSSVVLVVLFLFWRPIPATVWHVENGWFATLLQAMFVLGWLLVLFSTFLINHFELFGLHQAWAHIRGRPMPPPVLRQPLLYKIVRHPLYFGFLVAFWATPFMPIGHLVFAIGMTGYMLLAIPMEEKDLTAVFGDDYEAYRKRVRMILPGLPRKSV